MVNWPGTAHVGHSGLVRGLKPAVPRRVDGHHAGEHVFVPPPRRLEHVGVGAMPDEVRAGGDVDDVGPAIVGDAEVDPREAR